MYDVQSILNQIEPVVQQVARGVPAQLLGNHYAVYRNDSTKNGSVVSGARTIESIAARLKKAKKIQVESSTAELEVFEAQVDNTDLVKGDILVGIDADPSTYCYAQYRSLGPTMFVRVELAANIYRPRIGNIIPAGTAAASPGAPFVSPTFASSDLSTRDPLTLVNGVYTFSQTPTDTPATVPVGIQLTARAGGTRGANSLPGSSATARFVGYVPPLGVALNQDDVIYIDDDHSYIVNLALTETVGLIGTVCILEEEGE
jgi:hypothetical protein